MLFNSQIFLLVFLPACLILLALAGNHQNARIWILILLSAVFYGYWDLRFVPLLLGSVLVNWCFAAAFHRSGVKRLITLGIAVNLIVLGLFKYFDFFAESAAAVLGSEYRAASIILPLGISFFTFQQISYLVDMRRGTAPLYPLPRYWMYVTFFPQLIAGPIVRHNEFLTQLDAPLLPKGRAERTARGATLVLIGLCKKVLIADPIGSVADSLFAAAQNHALSFAEAWLAAFAFSLQIYFDFSGYSDMAIGLGLMFGFVLPLNFNAPYRATSISEFWRRWHMTLSRFLRDYLYIPLGGNRFGYRRQIMALVVTMLLGGLWHGAAWTFVVWGGLHGAALMVNHAWRRLGLKFPPALGWALTLLFVVACFVVFRAESFSHATGILGAMVGQEGFGLEITALQPSGWRPPIGSPALEGTLWVAVGLAIALLGRQSQKLSGEWLRPSMKLATVLAGTYAVIVVATGGPGATEFVYFQF